MYNIVQSLSKDYILMNDNVIIAFDSKIIHKTIKNLIYSIANYSDYKEFKLNTNNYETVESFKSLDDIKIKYASDLI